MSPRRGGESLTPEIEDADDYDFNSIPWDDHNETRQARQAALHVDLARERNVDEDSEAYKRGLEGARAAMAPSSVAGWAERIRPLLARTVEAIVATGRELIAAKEALPHGSWYPLLDELDLSPTMAQRFMRVARQPLLANPSRGTRLPASLNVLDELTRLDDDELAAAIEAGEIGPATTRAAAVAMARSSEPAIPATIEEAATELERIDAEIRQYRQQAAALAERLGGMTCPRCHHSWTGDPRPDAAESS
jgi:hypothetical protein